jgi:hypothetical protein
MKARQCAKIHELGQTLLTSGFRTLDEQAQVLGLSRSTAWTILKAQHKSSGLSVGVINRMLASRQLPSLVRSVIVEYCKEKAAGLYGGSALNRRRFAARLLVKSIGAAVSKSQARTTMQSLLHFRRSTGQAIQQEESGFF